MKPIYDATTNYANYNSYGPPGDGHWFALAVLGAVCLAIALATMWPTIMECIDWIRYRNNTIKSFIVCQKTPDIDLKKIYKVVDETNKFLRGKDMEGIVKGRKKIKTKNLISVTSVPGNGCYYFIIWYKGKRRPV